MHLPGIEISLLQAGVLVLTHHGISIGAIQVIRQRSFWNRITCNSVHLIGSTPLARAKDDGLSNMFGIVCVAEASTESLVGLLVDSIIPTDQDLGRKLKPDICGAVSGADLHWPEGLTRTVCVHHEDQLVVHGLGHFLQIFQNSRDLGDMAATSQQMLLVERLLPGNEGRDWIAENRSRQKGLAHVDGHI